MAFGLIRRKTAAVCDISSGKTRIERSTASLRIGQFAFITLLESDSGTSTRTLNTLVTEITPSVLRLRTEYDPALRSASPAALAIRSLRQGASLIVEIPDRESLIRFHSTLLELKSGHVFPGDRRIALAPPPYVARVQRRRAVRRTVHSPATFLISPDLPPVHGTLCEISDTGFSAELGAPLGIAEADQLLAALLPLDGVLSLRHPELLDPVHGRILAAKRMASRGGLAIRVHCIRLD